MKRFFFLGMFVIISLILFPKNLDARAGGGGSYSSVSISSSSGSSGSSSGGEGFLAFIAGFISLFIGGAGGVALGKSIEKKNAKALILLDKIDETDEIWNYRTIKERMENIFFNVQMAWTKRDQDIAKEYMSNKIYKKHKMQTDRLIENKLINKLERVNLISTKIIGIFDDEENDKDSLKAVINGGMIDFMYDEENNKIIAGSDKDYEEFSELWTFIRKDDNWVLDNIEQSVESRSVKNTKIFSHLLEV